MTRKDYVLLAEAINGVQQNWRGEDDLARLVRGAVYNVAERIALELAKDNPRFDYRKFMEACGFPR